MGQDGSIFERGVGSRSSSSQQIYQKKIKMNQNSWCEQSDQLLKYLYQDLKIFDWNLISKEITSRLGFATDGAGCRNRYAQISGPVVRDQWTPEEEKQLYRLHNQNGNKWAIIAQNLLGRTDNCVKNHFYSKLRKSLRTVNKVAKLFLKKQAKEVSDVVLYKLTEATDESLKPDSEISKEYIALCYDLKNKLLQYEIDQKDIKPGMDYSFEKELILGLSDFNKNYKKKSKKEKIAILGTENLRKRGNQGKKPRSKKRQSIADLLGDNFSSVDESYKLQDSKQKQPINKRTRKGQVKNHDDIKLENPYSDSIKREEQMSIRRSESEYSVPKRMVNYVIKAPSQEQMSHYENPENGQSQSRKFPMESQSHLVIPFMLVSPISQSKPKNRVEDILKAEGILENGDYGNSNKDYFRHSNSIRSFSVCSESSHPDMFGQDAVFAAGFKQLSEMDNESHLFNHQNE